MAQTATQVAMNEPAQAATPATSGTAGIAESKWKQAERLPCQVSVEVPIPGFTLSTLLTLQAASVVSSRRPTTANLPLRVNGELIAWCEFEVFGTRLSVRFTELA